MPTSSPASVFSRTHHPISPSLRLLICACLVLSFTACVPGSQASRITLMADGRWQASIALPAGASTDASAAAVGDLFAGLQEAGIEASSTVGQTLALSGSGGLLQVRRLIFNQLSQAGLAYQPGAQVALSGAIQQGEALTITLQANPSTGYAWQLAEYDPAGMDASAGWTFTTSGSAPGIDGASQPQVFSFQALETGRASLEFIYQRSWEEPPPGPRLEIEAPALADVSDLSLPDPLPAGLDAFPSAGPAPVALDVLPARWDWREQAVLPPARNQGSCGSCWAFATVGALETNIAIRDHMIVNLAEQYLVSCNSYGWSCAAGGGTAHGYHLNVFKNPPETVAGAVLESSYPYTGKDTACVGPNPHPYRLTNYSYVSGVEAIKQAIYTYGPVKTSVCAGSVFMGYHGGIYATDEKSACGGSTNHAVVLTGWDDTQGANGIWYLRNSWGTGWGEGLPGQPDKGYMRIDRTVSNIGANTSYVVYTPHNISYLPIIRR